MIKFYSRNLKNSKAVSEHAKQIKLDELNRNIENYQKEIKDEIEYRKKASIDFKKLPAKEKDKWHNMSKLHNADIDELKENIAKTKKIKEKLKKMNMICKK